MARISLVKPEKARRVEDMIIHAAQSGQLGGKVNEASLINLLDQISEKQQHTKITVPLSNSIELIDGTCSHCAAVPSTKEGSGIRMNR